MRKLLGYRLKDEKYREAVQKIILCLDEINVNSIAANELKQAGVMHWFDEVYEEEKLEVGKWYKDKTCDAVLIYFSGNREKGNYGFNRAGKWTNEYSIHNTPVSDYRPATTEEIQQALIKEATKRGFKEGVKVKQDLACHFTNQIIRGYDVRNIEYEIDAPNSLNFGTKTIFRDGNWAEILRTETLNGKTAIIDGVEYELKIKN